MKSARLSLSYLIRCAFVVFLLPLWLSAQEDTAAPEGKKALTFRIFPDYANDWNVTLTPDSQFLLLFNAPVEPNAVQLAMRLHESEADRLFPVIASRPTSAEIHALVGAFEGTLPDSARFVLLRPASPLTVGRWALYAEAGLASVDPAYASSEGQSEEIGKIRSFSIEDISTEHGYDEPLEISISLNKDYLAKEFRDPAKLVDYVTVIPTPPGLKLSTDYRKIKVSGAFDYGVDYTITIRQGLVAHDSMTLDQTVSEQVSFMPNEGFLTYPAFSTTQSATGHRKFDVHFGNLTGVRTRIKKLDGKDLVAALTQYSENYEGGGDKQTLAFESIKGPVIFDEIHDSDGKLDHADSVIYDWTKITKNSGPGAYFICSEGASSSREKLAFGVQSIIQLTDIGLAWKQDEKDSLLFAFSINTGKPLEGLEVTLCDAKSSVLATTTTGADGLARLDGAAYREKGDDLYLDTKLGDDRNAMRFSAELQSVGLWRFGVDQRWDKSFAGERRTMIFMDRDVYRPGDEVKVKAISRFVDTDKLLGPGMGKAKFRVFDGRNRKILERSISFGPKGSFDDSFTLSAEGMGWYSAEIDFNPEPVAGQDAETDWRLIENHSFQVQDYRVNTFEVIIDSQDEYTTTSQFRIPVSARYFMGKPLTKAEMEWNLSARGSFPSPRGFDDFEFGDQTVDEEAFHTTGTTRLDSKGSALASFSLPDTSVHPGPVQVKLLAMVTDANQQTLSGSKSFVVNSSDFYLGWRRPDDVVRVGQDYTFALAAVDTNGKPHTAQVDTNVLVEKEEWTTVKVMGANGRMVHRNEMRLRTVSDERIPLTTEVEPTTGLPRPQIQSLKLAEAGDYQITITSKDAEGRAVLTRAKFNIIGAEEPAWSWQDVVRIDLIPDKDQYKAGDTAKLLARTPVFGNALFTVERGGVREVRNLVIDKYETVFEVPVTENDAPNVFASLLIIRGSADSPHVHATADCRLGYCQINVTDPATALMTTISTGDAPYYQPGEEIEFSAKVADHLGAPVAGAEVTLYAVDEGVLSLSGYDTPDPAETFHAPFPLAVSTGQSLGDLFPENPLEQSFDNKGYVIGDGGGGFGIDPDRIRKNFQALALWEASLVTDDQGVVHAKAIAPDNLTSFRVMAVISEGNRFGNAEAKVVINKPLIIEPALPGFTNLTDQIDITAVLHNNSDTDQEVEVEVSLDEHAVFLNKIGELQQTSLAEAGAASPSMKKATARVSAGATETLSFPVGMVATGEAKWVWKATSLTDAKLKDAVESTFVVGYPLPMLREVRSVALRDGKTAGDALAEVDQRILSGTGSVKLTLSNTRLAGAADGLDYLLHYPYGCAEQTISTTIPWLTTQQLRRILPKVDRSEDQVKAVIAKGMERIFSMQTEDGGIAYWPGESDSMLWVSAYAGVAVAMAEHQGVSLPENAASSLRDYLSESLRKSGELTNSYELSQRCLAAYALALAGEAESAYHETLFNKRKLLSAEARSLLALAMIESNDTRKDRIQSLLEPDPKMPVAEVSWYRRPYIAAARLLTEVRRDPASPAIDRMVDDLLKLREPNDGWGGTYSNAWPLIALAAYSESSAKVSANEVVVSFDGKEQSLTFGKEPSGQEIELAYTAAPGANRTLTIKPAQSGAVYANVAIAARPQLKAFESENHGFAIHRNYQKVEIDGTIVPAENLMVGDLILVTLEINLPNEKENFLAIDDALPAIFEAVNPEFETSETQRVQAQARTRTLYTSYREIRKDRVLFFANSVYGAGDYSIQYLARVVAPGQVTAPPTKIEAMYEPQRYGLSATEQISAAARPLTTGKVASR